MSESYPATDIKKRKTLTAKAQETYDFITSVSEKLIRSRIDHILINDECLDAFARGEYPKGFDKARAVLVLPPNVSVDKRLTESFTVITPKDTDDLTDTLIKMGYESFSSPAFVHRSGDIAALHKTSESEEAYLLVNTGEDLNEKIVIRPEHINDVKAFQVYDPHGDTYTDLSVTRNKDTVTFTLHIPSREARIIKIKAD